MQNQLWLSSEVRNCIFAYLLPACLIFRRQRKSFTLPFSLELFLHFQRNHKDKADGLPQSPAVKSKKGIQTKLDFGQSTEESEKPDEKPVDEYSRSHIRQKKIEKAIAEMVAQDMLPLSFMEGPGFRKFMKELEPRFRNFSRRKLTRDINSQVDDKIIPALKAEISTIPDGEKHSTSDLWLTKRLESLIGVKMHYITLDWILKHPTIGLESFSGRHTGVNIAAAFEDVLMRVGVSPHEMGINVTDSAANMIKAFKLINEIAAEEAYDITDEFSDDLGPLPPEEALLECLEELVDSDNDDCDLDEELDSHIENRIACCAHLLQLCYKDAFKAKEAEPANNLLKHATRLVKWIRKSSYWHQRLYDKVKKSLKRAIDIRWNSNNPLLERVAEVCMIVSVS